MKTDWRHLEGARKLDGPMASRLGDQFGVFYIKRGGAQFIIIASNGSAETAWEHVSARVVEWKGERSPTWSEMCWLKDLFWDEEECVVQYHPPRSEYVNNHPFALHLWSPINAGLPRPPIHAV